MLRDAAAAPRLQTHPEIEAQSVTRWMKRRPIRLHALPAVVLLLCPTLLAAQEPTRPDSVIPLKGVVVSTVRSSTTTGGSSALVVSPDSLELPPAPTLEEALREIPFVGVRQNSRGQAEITVRGSDSRQVAVLLDGIPLTIGWDHRTDAGVIPISGARSIVTIRGLHSVLYGPNVLGGVVEIGVAGAGDARPRAPYRAAIGVDHLGGGSASVTGAHRAETAGGEWDLVAGGGYRDRPGVAVPDAAHDTLGRDDGMRTNSQSRLIDSFFSARYEGVAGGWFGATASGALARRGVPPELHVREPRLWRYPEETRGLLVLSGGTGERRTVWGAGDLELSLGADLGGSRIDSYESADYDRIVATEKARGRTLTARLLGDHTLLGGTLTGSATFSDVVHRETVDAAETNYRQRLWSIATEVLVPADTDTRVSGGLAMDGADTPRTGGRPALGTLTAWGGRLGASTVIRERIRVHGAISRRARFPSLRELYSGALGRFDPNPSLRPETLLGAEAGLTAHLPGLQVQGVAFRHHLSDAVARIVTEEGLFRRVNRDEIRSFGFELLLDAEIGAAELMGDVMVQSVTVSDDPDGAARHAEHQPAIRASGAGAVPLPLRLTGVVDVGFTGSQYCVHPDHGGDVRLDAGGTLGAGLRRTWRRAGTPLRISARVENLTDAATYDQCGLPRPGRTLRLSFELG